MRSVFQATGSPLGSGIISLSGNLTNSGAINLTEGGGPFGFGGPSLIAAEIVNANLGSIVVFPEVSSSSIQFDSFMNDGDITVDGGSLDFRYLNDPASTTFTNNSAGVIQAINGADIDFCGVSYDGEGSVTANGEYTSISFLCSNENISIDGAFEALDNAQIMLTASTVAGSPTGSLTVDGMASLARLSGDTVILPPVTLVNGGSLSIYSYQEPSMDVSSDELLHIPFESTFEIAISSELAEVSLTFDLTNEGATSLWGYYDPWTPFTLTGNISNTGQFQLWNLSLDVTGSMVNTDKGTLDIYDASLSGEFTNSHIVQGYGEIDGDPLNNNAGGEIIAQGVLTLKGTITNNGTFTINREATLVLQPSSLLQKGLIDVADGGTLQLDTDITNQGLISLDGGLITGQELTHAGGAEIVGYGEISCNLLNQGAIEVDPLSDMTLTGNTVVNNGVIDLPILALLVVDTAGFSQPSEGELHVGLDAAALFIDTFENSGSVFLAGGAISAPEVVNHANALIGGFGEIDSDLTNHGVVAFFGNSAIIGEVHNELGAILSMSNQSLSITGLTTNEGTIETLNAEIVFVGGLVNNGELIVDPSTILVSDLSVGPDGVIIATDQEANEVIVMGDFNNASDEADAWSTEHAILRFNGGDAQQSLLEAASTDNGCAPSSYEANFAWGTLHVGPSAIQLTLQDEVANGSSGKAEAVYVTDLLLDPDTVLDLNGLNLYYRGIFVNNGGTIIGGTPIAVVSSDCPADLTGDGEVGSPDLAVLLGNWGACPAPCPADLAYCDNLVNAADLAFLLFSWGFCK